jgi:magnesium transporter
MVHIGQLSTEAPQVQVLRYNADLAEEITLKGIAELQLLIADKEMVYWIDVIGLNHLDTITEIGKLFDIHPLALEDIVNTEQRPKYEEYESFFFLTMKTMEVKGSLCHVDYQQLSIVCGTNFVITFQEKDNKLFSTVQKRLLNGASRARTRRSDFLVYLLSDSIVDSYFTVIEKFTDVVDEMEAAIIKGGKATKGTTIQQLQTVRRNFSSLLRQLFPLREALSRIDKKENDMISDETRIYFRDVADHCIHLTDTVENLREILSGTMDVYLASINTKMNSIMKVLTVISTIFMPLSFLASVFGMNFKYFPELYWKYGYLYFWILVMCIVGGMFIYFKKKKWM